MLKIFYPYFCIGNTFQVSADDLVKIAPKTVGEIRSKMFKVLKSAYGNR